MFLCSLLKFFSNLLLLKFLFILFPILPPETPSKSRYWIHIRKTRYTKPNTIKCQLYLNSLSRVSAQKMIMKILREDLKKRIHALEISIEK